jgi:hypothetical protein
MTLGSSWSLTRCDRTGRRRGRKHMKLTLRSRYVCMTATQQSRGPPPYVLADVTPIHGVLDAVCLSKSTGSLHTSNHRAPWRC